MSKMTLGVIVGNRGFFPDHLCESGRKTILKVLAAEGIGAVILPVSDRNFGSVENLADARRCADLFRRQRDKIGGVLVTLPNFGDERAVANTLRWAGLDVPVLVHAFSDDAGRMTRRNRRDSFCGKMSVCNNLRQYGLPFSLTRSHTVDPESEEFRADLRRFAGICRVVRGMANLRIGVIGARPAAFNTVRFSEKLLESSGITVETVDLSEIMGRANRLKDGEAVVKAKLKEINAYTSTQLISKAGVLKMSKLGVAIDRWLEENEVAASALQCWTALEEFYGVVPCALMSMLSQKLMPSACETDVGGVIGMYAMQLASGRPSALLDWNNNYGTDPDKCMLFHCSNLPRSFFVDQQMSHQPIIADTVGKENTFGTIVGRIKPGPFTYLRIATDDTGGRICGYTGSGEFTADAPETFGGYGVARIPDLQTLLAFICRNGFEHHVAVSLSQTADIVEEALEQYLGWDIYHHAG